jgi:hypothetical protein
MQFWKRMVHGIRPTLRLKPLLHKTCRSESSYEDTKSYPIDIILALPLHILIWMSVIYLSSWTSFIKKDEYKKLAITGNDGFVMSRTNIHKNKLICS